MRRDRDAEGVELVGNGEGYLNQQGGLDSGRASSDPWEEPWVELQLETILVLS